MSAELVNYALSILNQDREETPYVARDITVVSVAEHANSQGNLIGKVKVTFKATGSVVYLDRPADFASEGSVAVTGEGGDSVEVPEDLDGLTVKDLKEIAGNLGVKKSGTKAQLIARISAAG